MDDIVSKMPSWMTDKFNGVMKGSKQGHGKNRWWSLAVDMAVENDKVLLRGSCGISGDVAEPFADELCKMLKDRGFACSRTEMTV